MIKKTILFLAAAALVMSGCAKKSGTTSENVDKRYFDAWMHVHHPDLVPTPLGAYVLEDTEGDGNLVGVAEQSRYVRVDYTVTDLDGNVSATTSKKVAQQIGTYSDASHYGPAIWDRSSNGVYAGLDEALSTMRVGGSRKTIIPGWLLTFDRYDTAQEYVDNASGTNAVYTLAVREVIEDVSKWELDSIGHYLEHKYPQVALADSVKYGFYYVRTKEPEGLEKFENDTTIYINYTGRLLDGTVFDTTVKDTAKVYGIYSASKSYTPTQVNLKTEDYTQNSFSGSGSSSLIDGFAYALSLLGEFEAGTSIFYSPLGYSISGSGNSIPAYSPLRFDIEVVSKP